jgi:hypothetical protein
MPLMRSVAWRFPIIPTHFGEEEEEEEHLKFY